MRISNPKTTAGGLPLATTWYVNKRFEGTKEYITSALTDMTTYVDTEVSAERTARIATDEALSTHIDTQVAALSAASDTRDSEVISAFCKYITGKGDSSDFVQRYLPTATDEDPAVYYQPKTYGYAYLGSDHKIASELMPDISVMDVNVVDAKDIFDHAVSAGYLDHDNPNFYGELSGNPQDMQKILTVVKGLIEKYVIDHQTKNGEIKAYGQGDIFVVTYFNSTYLTEQLGNASHTLFKDVFAQTYMAGAWICNAETRNTVNAWQNDSISFVKISYNQGEIVSVNGLVPGSNGDVTLNLAQIYKTTGGVIGDVLAGDIQKIKSTSTDTNALLNVVTSGGLVDFLNIAERFVFDDSAHSNCFAYATANEFMNLNRAAEAVRGALSAAIDAEVARATGVEGELSAAIDAEAARATGVEAVLSGQIGYVSGVVGTEADLSGVTVTSALLSVKDYAETVNTNVNNLAAELSKENEDVLKVFTLEIPSGEISSVKEALAAQGISVTCSSYIETHTGWDSEGLYENDIYNFFGIKKNTGFTTPDIAEITFTGFAGRILDIYVVNGTEFEKIDADINYKETVVDYKTVRTASFQVLGEFDRDAGTAAKTNIDKMIVRYTSKFEFEPTAPNVLFKD